VERLTTRTVLGVALAVMAGFAVWQLLSAVGFTIANALVNEWEDDPLAAEFEVAGLTVEYGQALSAAITLVLAAIVLWLFLPPLLERRPHRGELR
jgi:hypothetical protein